MEPPTRFDPNLLTDRLVALKGLAQLREAAGEHQVYLVGGAVRDLVLGRPRADVDVAVDGDVAELARRLGDGSVVHERFGTATVIVGGLRVDLARTRAESYTRPGALPDVRPASIAEDLARRDFSINAMAVPLHRELELIDPHDGVADLEAGIVRVLHERSFADDPTRALRAARYAARFGFELEPRTAELLCAADLSTVSTDRVEAELRKLAREDDPRAGFELVSRWGLVELPRDALELIGRLPALLDDPKWTGVTTREEAIVAVSLDHGGDWRELSAASPERPSEAVSIATGRSGVELAIARAAGAEWLDRFVGEWRRVGLEIDGGDLLAAGIPEGEAIGRGLEAALRRKLDGKIAGRDEELRAALEVARREL